jgi:membrane fusion protein, multidrug efflux system
MKKIINKLIAASKYALRLVKKTIGMLVAAIVIVMLIVSSFLVVLRMDKRPRTDDAFLLAYYSNIAPEVSGQIISINIQNNQSVLAGDVLFVIDPEPFQYKLDALRAEHKVALSTLERMQPLLQKGYVTAEDIDKQISLKDTTKANENLARRDLLKTVVKAPFKGKIVGFNYAVGQYATTGTPLFTMIDTSRWYAVANFRETDIARMKHGAVAKVYVMAHPQQVLQGHVESIGWGVTSEDATQSTGLPTIQKTLNWVRLAQRFPVRILLNNPPDHLMRIGASAVVVVEIDPSPQMNSLLSDFGPILNYIGPILNYFGWYNDTDAAIPAN